MNSYRVIVLLYVSQFVDLKSVIRATDTIKSVSNIFEALGYAPSCVAKSLASCDNSLLSSHENEITASLTTIITILNEMKPVKIQPKNCAEVKATGDCNSEVRTIYPSGCLSAKPFEVFCDQSTDGGGWTVFQNRDNLTVRENFFRSWNDYVAGFGDLTGEFWLGLDKLQSLVSSTKMELRVDLEDYEGEKRWAKYSSFSIGDSSTKYKLSIGGYTGDAGDGFGNGRHNGRKFTTMDQDNDENAGSCANLYKGGWWYDSCHISNLNGFQHVGKHASYADGINWHPWKDYHYSFRKSSMKIRPV